MSNDASIALSAVALQRANEARKSACLAAVPGYEHKTATVEQMQNYAGCIKILYPSEVSGGADFVLKAVILFAFIGGASGAIWVWRNKQGIEILMYMLLGVLVFPLVPLVIAGVYYGALFLFS